MVIPPCGACRNWQYQHFWYDSIGASGGVCWHQWINCLCHVLRGISHFTCTKSRKQIHTQTQWHTNTNTHMYKQTNTTTKINIRLRNIWFEASGGLLLQKGLRLFTSILIHPHTEIWHYTLNFLPMGPNLEAQNRPYYIVHCI